MKHYRPREKLNSSDFCSSKVRKYCRVIAIFLTIVGCSSGSETAGDSELAPQGVYISDPFVMFGTIATITLTIKENRFIKRFELSDGRDGFEQTGSINVVGPAATEGGLAGQKIDVVYEDDSVSGAPSSIYPKEVDYVNPYPLDIVYLDQGVLYFGIAKTKEECEGAYYEFQPETINNTVRAEPYERCLDRPTALNFDFPYREVISTLN